MDSLRMLLAFCLLFGLGSADIINSICHPVKTNYGYIPPKAPYNFILKYRERQSTDTDSKVVEIYFDLDNARYMKTEIKKGLITKEIYDYKQKLMTMYDQTDLVYWAELPHCKIEKLTDELNAEKGFQFLNYGLSNFQQNGNGETRGIRALPFNTCYVDKMTGETRNVTIMMTVDAFQTECPFGADGIFKIQITAGIESGGAIHTDEITQDVFWYDPNPKFQDKDFQLPPDAFCYSGAQSKPPITSKHRLSLSTKMETTVLVDGKQVINEEELDIDTDHGMLKEVYKSNDNVGKIGILKASKLEVVMDLNLDIALVYNEDQRKCQIVKLDSFVGDHLITQNGGKFRFVGPNNIIDKYIWSFKMKKTYENVPMDVWVSETKIEDYYGRKANVIMELMFLDELWQLNAFEAKRQNAPLRIKKQYKFIHGKSPKEIVVTTTTYDRKEVQPSTSKFYMYKCFYQISHTTARYELKILDGKKDFIRDNSLSSTAENKIHYGLLKAMKIEVWRTKLIWSYVSEEDIFIYMSVYDVPVKSNVTASMTYFRDGNRNFRNMISGRNTFSVQIADQSIILLPVKIIYG